MKKRLISILLMVCIVASLLAGMAGSAYADGYIVNHTMQNGDTVIAVCKNLGLDFFTCKQAIMQLNNFSSDADFNRLRVGQTIKLPASNADAALIVSSGAASGGTAGGTTTGGTTTGGTTNVTSVQLLTGDYVAYYLIPHVVQAGETVYDICNVMGINFHENSDLIMKVNSIKSWNRLFVGRTIMLPSTKAPASGACTVVVAHKVVGGDTVYTLCQKYGISYKDSLEMLQILNKKENLAVIKVGQILLMPISGVVTGGTGGGAGGVVVPGGTGTGTGTGSGTGTGGTTTLTFRNITTKAPNGVITATVDGAAKTSALPGKTVSINVSPNKGYALDGKVVVYLADNSGTVLLNADNTFTMPDCDVRIEASFKSGYTLTKDNDNSKGTFNLLVNDVATQAAFKDAQVTIKIAPKEGNAVASVAVVGTKSGSSWYAWNDGQQEYSFKMPGEDVTVKVTYKTVASYTLTKGTVSNGTFSLSNNNGSVISKSSANNTVYVVPKANSGYEIDKVSYTYKNGSNDVTTTVAAASDGSYSFQMPAANTTVNVSFKNVAMYSLTKDFSDKRCSVTLTVNGVEVDRVAEGQTVAVAVTVKAGYKLSSIKVDGSSISGSTFKMPGNDVEVRVLCVEADTFNIWPDNDLSTNTAHGSYSMKIDGEAVTGLSGTAYEGRTITIEPKPDTNYHFEKLTVLDIAKNEEIAVDSSNSFKMPAGNVRISIKYTLDAPEIAIASASNGTVKTYVGNEEASTAAIGSKVTIKLNANDGYIADSVKVTKADGSQLTVTTVNAKQYEFAMPAEKVTVTVTFRPLSQTISTAFHSTVGSTFTLKVNDKDVTLDANGEVEVKTGDKITIVPKPATNSSLDQIIVTKNGDVNTVVSTSTEFTMPAYDVKITVYFK